MEYPHGEKPGLETSWKSGGSPGDSRPTDSWPGVSGAGVVGRDFVTSVGSNVPDFVFGDVTTYDASMALASIMSYRLVRLQPRRIRDDRLLRLDQVEIEDTQDARMVTVDCDAVESLYLDYDNPTSRFDAGEVKFSMVRLGASCEGVTVRGYGNMDVDLAEIAYDAGSGFRDGLIRLSRKQCPLERSRLICTSFASIHANDCGLTVEIKGRCWHRFRLETS